jgi:hypothetical protein
VSIEAGTKVRGTHLTGGAYLYVRQSTLRQVMNNTESTARQYALRQRAVAFGWLADAITVIDSDQGHSGASAADREGFQHLVAEVGMGRAGIVLGLEVSRLARNNADWHRLLEICALTDTLLLDEDGLYNPSHFNDRLVLGLNRPDTQSTSYSTSCRSRPITTIFRFRSTARLAFGQSIPPANIPDMLTGIAPAKGGAQSGAIKMRSDLVIATLSGHFVNL